MRARYEGPRPFARTIAVPEFHKLEVIPHRVSSNGIVVWKVQAEHRGGEYLPVGTFCSRSCQFRTGNTSQFCAHPVFLLSHSLVNSFQESARSSVIMFWQARKVAMAVTENVSVVARSFYAQAAAYFVLFPKRQRNVVTLAYVSGLNGLMSQRCQVRLDSKVPENMHIGPYPLRTNIGLTQ
jgi:hypothetical protein